MSNSDNIIKIRPHHGMCIQFFRGEGYNDKFVQGMSSIINMLNAGASVELTDCTDSVCMFCPNNLNGTCKSDDRVSRFDCGVIEICGLNYGDVLTWREFCDSVRRNIIECGRMKSICGDCQWSYICYNTDFQ